MNKILIILSLVLLASCGPSQEDKRNVAAVTCSIMGETRNMDAAVRVEKINDARQKIGGEPFLRGDDAIKESFEYGLCQELVLNEWNEGNFSMSYDEKLQSRKDAEREIARIDREAQAEEQRVAAHKQRVIEERKAALKRRAMEPYRLEAEKQVEALNKRIEQLRKEAEEQ